MSLINDALQRAKQQTTQPAPAADLPLRPLEPAQAASQPRLGLALPATLATIVVAAIAAAWLLKKSEPAAETIQPPAQAMAPLPVSAAPKVEPAAPLPAPALPSLANTETNTAASQSINGTAAMTEVTAALPPPPEPKLQAIIFHPSRPSAMISGKTVRVGDRVGPLQVREITARSVVLASDTTTRTLALED